MLFNDLFTLCSLLNRLVYACNSSTTYYSVTPCSLHMAHLSAYDHSLVYFFIYQITVYYLPGTPTISICTQECNSRIINASLITSRILSGTELKSKVSCHIYEDPEFLRYRLAVVLKICPLIMITTS